MPVEKMPEITDCINLSLMWKANVCLKSLQAPPEKSNLSTLLLDVVDTATVREMTITAVSPVLTSYIYNKK